MKPTVMSGQSVCSGCGSDDMSCGGESLLTNVTREPTATVMSRGDTPADVMVIVVVVVDPPGGGVGVGVGAGVLEPPSLPPQRRGQQRDQKNFREMLNPRYQLSSPMPPRAI